MASPTRTEAWNEPDAQIPPPKTPEERSGTPRRLGILPSPAPTAGTFEEGRERRASREIGRRRSSAVRWEGSGDGDGDVGDLGLETVPSEGGTSSEDVKGVEEVKEEKKGEKEEEDEKNEEEREKKQEEKEEERPAPIRKSSDLAVLPSQRAAVQDDPEISPPLKHTPSAQRPQPRPRKFSDLELLPSQRRLSPLNIARPDSMTLTTLNFSSNESVDVEDAVHQASPVTIKPMSPPVVVVQAKEGMKDDEADEKTPVTRRLQDNDDGLYESIPVANKSTEQSWQGGGGERKVSGSTTADYEDARSEVSAEEGAQQESSHHSTNPTTSRHSSVSSLGRGAVEEEAPPVMSAQAVPAAPVGASPTTTTQPHLGVLQELTAAAAARQQPEESTEYQQRFANRQYPQQRPGMGERPMSYMTLPRDAQGLIQERISTGKDEPPQQQQPVDLSGMAGPPPGAPPFSQHPAVRNSGVVQPTQYERLRSSVVSTGSGHTPHSSADMTGRPPSGFFRGPPSMEQAMPPPSRMSDQHGLEGVHTYGQVGTEAQPRPPQEDKQGRRRSGLWETLTSRRSSGAQKFDSSRESSVAPQPPPSQPQPLDPAAVEVAAEPPPIKMADSPSDSKRRTLKKPQRASSSVAETEPKKKRFSKLGSLFGRSSTVTGSGSGSGSGSASKPNRLTKNAPAPSREGSVAQKAPQPQNSSTVVGSVRGYEAYEAARRRDMPAFQETSVNAPPTPPPQSQPQVQSAVKPPPGGWYGPQQEQTAPRPEFRRLHSESRRGERERGLAQVPEAFRPVQASFRRPVEPIGPPPGQEPPVMRERGPSYGSSGPGQSYGQTPSAMMDAMMDPTQPRHPQQPAREPSYPHDPQQRLQRQMSYGSEGTPPPISGRSEHYPPGSRPFGSLPSISPVQTRTGTIPEENVARSPAREYADQQTPWAITLPQGAQSGRSSRASSWGQGQGQGYDPRGGFPGQEYGGYGYVSPPPPPPPQYRPHASPPPQGQGLVLTDPANVGFYPPPPRGQRRIEIPWEEEQPVRQQQYGPYPSPPTQQQYYGYASPPPQQQQQQQRYPPPQQQQYFPPHPRPPLHQNRFYAQQRQYSGGMHQRRPSSGYSGRRDDLTVGEEDLVMRGASYPGQEWAPPGLGRD